MLHFRLDASFLVFIFVNKKEVIIYVWWFLKFGLYCKVRMVLMISLCLFGWMKGFVLRWFAC